MFRHPIWAVGSYCDYQTAAGTIVAKSTGGFNRPDVSPCSQISKLTRVPLDAEDLLVASVREHPEERLCGEADHVLLLERHRGVDAHRAALAGVGDARGPGQEEAGRQQLEDSPVFLRINQ